MNEPLLGFADFRRATGCDNVRLRLMEAAHVLTPARTQTGWRVFTQADVETAKQWLAENSSKRERA
jgi:DNA-binding transcriptional MerR regulator